MYNFIFWVVKDQNYKNLQPLNRKIVFLVHPILVIKIPKKLNIGIKSKF